MCPRRSCPACQSSSTHSLLALPYNTAPIADHLRAFYHDRPSCNFAALNQATYSLHECDHCGCIYQNPVPDDAYLKTFYTEGLYAADAPRAQRVNPYEFEHVSRELAMIVRFLHPTESRPIALDFGTGDGRWAMQAAASGLDVHGTDLSAHAFPHLRKFGITCHSPDELPEQHFHFINTEQVFEHLTTPSDWVKKLAQALRPGGVLKIGTPYDRGLRQKLRQPDWSAPKNDPRSLNAVAPIEHLNHYEPESLTALARGAGLIRLETQGWDLFRPDDNTKPRNLRSRLARMLRDATGDRYRPLLPLTQTHFFWKPAI